MMKKVFFVLFLFTLFFASLPDVSAQTNNSDSTYIITSETNTTPQWLRDVRRFDIIAFGMFPFSMFFSTFFYDLYRWNNANGFDFSEEGRGYAPWPLKSSKVVALTDKDYGNIVLVAAGLSLTFALTDLIITLVKRDKEKRRIQNIPSGSFTIERNPYGDIEVDGSPPANEQQ